MSSLKSTLMIRFAVIVLLHTLVTLVSVYIITLYNLKKSADWELAKFEKSLIEAINDGREQDDNYNFYTLGVGEESRFSFFLKLSNGQLTEAGQKVASLRKFPFREGFDFEGYKKFSVYRKTKTSEYVLYTSVHSELDLIDDTLWIFLLTLPLLLIPAIYFSYRIFNQLANPLKNISAVLAKIEKGKLQSRIAEGKYHIEVESLSRSLNQTFECLESLFEQSKRFNAHAAHELKTPLTVIQGEIDLCMQGPAEIEQYESCLLKVQEEIYRYRKIIENLLLISSSGEISKHGFVEFNVSDSLNDVIDLLRILAKEKGIELSYEEDGGEIVGGQKLLSQAIFNLVENAIKYSKSGSRVKIVLNREEFSVEDGADQLSEEDKVKILEPFHRKAVKENGIGLGLNIVVWICSLHGFHLEIDSALEGNIFTIKF
ncbi:MAG: HAMP domain-containing histidine kinase [Lentisphaerales bacterium]|nr:HAMP domain-containing histidine kinase [Lentisphaerales bacterium]